MHGIGDGPELSVDEALGKRPLCLLFVHSDLQGGGTEQCLLTLARSVRAAKKLIAYRPTNHPEPSAELVESLAADGVETHRLPIELASFGAPFRLSRLIAAHRPDIVHCHGTLPAILGGFLKRLFRRREIIIGTQHVHHSLDSPRLRVLARHTYPWLDHIVCVAESVRDELLGEPRLSSCASKVSVIPNGVDLSRFSEPVSERVREEVRTEVGVGPGEWAIGCVGLMWPPKGQDMLLRALPQVLGSLPDARLVLVGAGSCEDQLRRLAAELGISDRVIFTGWRGDVPRLFRGLDAYVQPSLSEGLPTALIEASAAGLPVVATDVGGTSTVVVDGETGVLVRPCDPSSLATAMVRMAMDPDATRRMAEAAKTRAFTHFAAETMAQHHMRLYSRLMGHSGPSLAATDRDR